MERMQESHKRYQVNRQTINCLRDLALEMPSVFRSHITQFGRCRGMRNSSPHNADVIAWNTNSDIVIGTVILAGENGTRSNFYRQALTMEPVLTHS